MTDAEKLRNLEDAVRQYLSAEAAFEAEGWSEIEDSALREVVRAEKAEALMHATMADG